MIIGTTKTSDLVQRYQQTEILKEQILSEAAIPAILSSVAEPIVHSWQRCAHNYHIPSNQDCAPRDDEYEAQQHWAVSPLRPAVQSSLSQLSQLAQQSNLVVVLGDHRGKMLWTCASKTLQASAERSAEASEISNACSTVRFGKPSISRMRPEKMFFLPFFSMVNKPWRKA